jgi:hypothetical protein
MTPTEYEQAVLQQFRTDWPPPQFDVRHNIRLLGRKTKARRQIEISIFEAGKLEPCLIVETKRHKRTIDAGKAGAVIALVQDVGKIPAVMVSTCGFSVAARNHLDFEGIGSLVVTLKDAEGLRWIPLVEEKFAVAREFREDTGHLVEALRNGDAEPFSDSDLPYEEWLAVVDCGLSLFPESTARMLKALAREHFDDGVRFNAVMLLDDAGQLEAGDLEAVIRLEQDPDALEALLELRDDVSL